MMNQRKLPPDPADLADGKGSRVPCAAEAVRRRLYETGYPSLRAVVCEVHAGVLTLRGRVPSYYLKQVAQAVARRIDGIEALINRIEVVYRD
jgi:osmotically-inducible protein OsmY